MRLVIPSLVVLALVPGFARAGGKVALRMNLVRAYCQAEGPLAACVPSFDVKGGIVQLTTSKQPGPSCPKTGQPSELPGGTVTLTGVTKDGAPYDGGELVADVVYKTSFGSDPNGNCVLADTQIVTSSLGATITCKKGKCKGTLYPIACLPKSCANVPLTTELSAMRVCNGLCVDTPLPNANAVAAPGIYIAPAASDAS